MPDQKKDEHCIHESDWGKLEKSLENIERGQRESHGKLNRVLEVVFGKDMNGGIVTQTRMNTDSIQRLNKIGYAIIAIFLATGVKVWFF